MYISKLFEHLGCLVYEEVEENEKYNYVITGIDSALGERLIFQQVTNSLPLFKKAKANWLSLTKSRLNSSSFSAYPQNKPSLQDAFFNILSNSSPSPTTLNSHSPFLKKTPSSLTNTSLNSTPYAPIFCTGAAPTVPGIKDKFSSPPKFFSRHHWTNSCQFSPAPTLTITSSFFRSTTCH